ncbi:MAG TPA: M15 family metallopeptidase [Candidatus Paceibacterota bacterium]
METKPHSFGTKYILALGAIFLAMFGLIAYLIYSYYILTRELVQTHNEFASTTSIYVGKLKSLQIELANKNRENTDLNSNLEAERTRNDNFENQIGTITSKVGVLDKLSKTDPQLLQKYSKVYFLNEHYVPANLIEIDPRFVYPKESKDKPEQILANVWPHLEDLLVETSTAGNNLQIISAYRSYGEQSSLKSGYKFTYGAGTANQFSADQGYSEHQLGTTVDFTAEKIGDTFRGFEKTKAYDWLINNAHRFGFTLSYPESNSYYVFEPWHWRYVGVTLATKINQENIHFYDLDQRVINQYLINLF